MLKVLNKKGSYVEVESSIGKKYSLSYDSNIGHTIIFERKGYVEESLIYVGLFEGHVNDEREFEDVLELTEKYINKYERNLKVVDRGIL